MCTIYGKILSIEHLSPSDCDQEISSATVRRRGVALMNFGINEHSRKCASGTSIKQYTTN